MHELAAKGDHVVDAVCLDDVEEKKRPMADAFISQARYSAKEASEADDIKDKAKKRKDKKLKAGYGKGNRAQQTQRAIANSASDIAELYERDPDLAAKL